MKKDKKRVRKSSDMHVRFTQEERELVDERAKAECLKPAAYVKRKVLLDE